MSETTSPSYLAKHVPREIRSFSDIVMDYLCDGATTASELAVRFQCPVDDIEETLTPLIRQGLVEQCGQIERGNKQTAALYAMARTKKAA